MQKIDKKVTYRSGYKHQNDKLRVYQTDIIPSERLETRFITLDIDGRLFINGGYAWDGPTGVPAMWGTRWLIRPSLIHDALYQLLRYGLLEPGYRKAADLEFLEACKADAKFKVMGNVAYWAVRKFGKFGADPANKRKVLTAP